MTQGCIGTRPTDSPRVVARYQWIRVFIQVVALMAKVRTICLSNDR